MFLDELSLGTDPIYKKTYEENLHISMNVFRFPFLNTFKNLTQMWNKLTYFYTTVPENLKIFIYRVITNIFYSVYC